MKKIPPWALVAGAIAIGAVFWLYKKRKEQAAKEAAETEGANEAPMVAGVEEAEGYPYSIAGTAGGGVGGGALGNALESQNELQEFFKSEQTLQAQQSKEQSEFEKNLAQEFANSQRELQRIVAEGRSTVGTPSGGGSSGGGGAAPGGGTIPQGSGGGPPSEPRPGVVPAPPVPHTDACGQGVHAGFPNGTPPDCWRISRTKTGGGCECHGHQNGQLQCQRGKAPNCYW
jgi:hypothetical protein